MASTDNADVETIRLAQAEGQGGDAAAGSDDGTAETPSGDAAPGDGAADAAATADATTETALAAAESADAAGGASGMPQLDFASWPSQILWLVIALVILYFLMSRIALPRIASVIEERHDAIENDIDRAAEYKRQAEEAEKAYTIALNEARAKAQEIAQETRAKIQEQVDAAMAEADQRIAARSAESEARIQEIQAEATRSVETVATDVAAALVDRLMPGTADSDAVASAVQARMT